MTSQQIKLRSGLQIHYESAGEGLPVICIPGWGYSTKVFANNMDALAAQYHVIALDPRSHGDSEISTEGNDYGQHGEDLKEFMDALQIKECVFLAWSLGAYAMYAYINQYGTKSVRAAVMVDESPRIIKGSEDDWGEGNAEEIQGLIDTVASGGYLEFWREYMAAAFVTPPSDALLDKFVKGAASLTPDVAAGLLSDAAKRDYTDTAIAMARDIPTLNILREEWAPDARKWIAQYQPQSEIEVFGNHLMLYEFADRFNQRVLDFLQRVLAR